MPNPLTPTEADAGLGWYYDKLMVWPTGEIHYPQPLEPRVVAYGVGDGVAFERSPAWRALRLAWVREHPACAACGGNRLLQVHHKRPFHLFPDLELDRSNLMTLCEQGRGSNCHLLFGHGCDWSRYVKDPEAVAAMIRMQVFVDLQPATRAALEEAVKTVLGGRLLRRDQ